VIDVVLIGVAVASILIQVAAILVAIAAVLPQILFVFVKIFLILPEVSRWGRALPECHRTSQQNQPNSKYGSSHIFLSPEAYFLPTLA
jgi:hypothetical protein